MARSVHSPVEGGAPDTVDDAAAISVAGVIDVVRLPYGFGPPRKRRGLHSTPNQRLNPG